MQLAYAPVKVKRVGCFEGISEKERHLVERNSPVRHDEIGGLAIVCSADAIADVGKGTFGQKARMQFAVNHKHRTGLCSVGHRTVEIAGKRGFQ